MSRPKTWLGGKTFGRAKNPTNLPTLNMNINIDNCNLYGGMTRGGGKGMSA